ncbi:MAG: DNA translocase SpoIIIE [candidate division BRC1 bacterium ADurb.Bin183]|nr:MAG: DNA translocase SpoIIIE [candidate division BRC1 bacterium ADurb.Bin183]
MAKGQIKTPASGSAVSLPYSRFIAGGVIFLLGLFLFLISTFTWNDAILFGSLGGAIREKYFLCFGRISSIILPLLLMLWSIRTVFVSGFKHKEIKFLAIFVFILMLCAILTLPFYRNADSILALKWGGIAGGFLTRSHGLGFPQHIGIVGSLILFLALFIPSLLLSTDMLFYKQIKAFLEWRKKRKAQAEAFKTSEVKIVRPATEKTAKSSPVIQKPEPAPEPKKEEPKPKPEPVIQIPKKITSVIAEPVKEKPTPAPAPRKISDGYKLPSVSLLQDAPPIVGDISEEEIRENCEILEKTLANFGIEVKVIQVTQGPVVTLYAMKPAPGVKVNRIVSLENDLAMALRAIKVRIQAPIPGKDSVGIEVPNRKEQGVYLKEILTCEKMHKARSPLAFCLGKTISGEPFIGDLAKMPHLLIAGATGSGKSVCLNSLIASLLFRQTPDRVKFMLIDPKRVEMSVYQAIPHLMAPVLCEPRKAAAALGWAVEHMEDRYKVLAEVGVRNIDSYNALATSDQPHKKLMGREVKYMPHIVIVIDELADLMMIARNEVEEFVIRLAQLSRAVGIHLVIATQRPSVNVITGIIKANFPSRIAFQVSSKVDSRTIIDMNGAETLLGRGDMLFTHAGAPKPIRIQGAFVSEEEIEALADFIRAQEKAIYMKEDFKEIEKPKKGESAEGDDDLVDLPESPDNASDEELYKRALELVLRRRKPSVSMIQRCMKIGYARAGRLMDMMEEAGIVGPYQGSKPRDLLVDPDAELEKLGLSKSPEDDFPDEGETEEELDDSK